MDLNDFEVGIASVCETTWESMHGDDKRRFCHKCDLFAHDVEALSQAEKFDLIRMAQNKNNRSGKLLVRPDGKVLIQDCPIGAKTFDTTVQQATKHNARKKKQDKAVMVGSATVVILVATIQLVKFLLMR